MQVLRRPHLPDRVAVSITAALLAIVITLALSAGLNDITTHATPAGASPTHTIAPNTVAAPSGVAERSAPAWVQNPFASLTPGPVALPWFSGGR